VSEGEKEGVDWTVPTKEKKERSIIDWAILEVEEEEEGDEVPSS